MRWVIIRIEPSPEIRNFFSLPGIYDRDCNLFWSFWITSLELKSWASWHMAQEHRFLEHEHSTAGCIASTKESAKICEILPVPPAESGQCSAMLSCSSAQGSEHTSALHGELLGQPGRWPAGHSVTTWRWWERGSSCAPCWPEQLLYSPSLAMPCTSGPPMGTYRYSNLQHLRVPCCRKPLSSLGCKSYRCAIFLLWRDPPPAFIHCILLCLPILD